MSRSTPKAPKSSLPGGVDVECYINREQLRALIPSSDMTVWRWTRNLGFPQPVKLGQDGRNYWWLPAVRAWTRQRAERRRNNNLDRK
jgi:predicted DNA-binding transcriptional regulator AlpA